MRYIVCSAVFFSTSLNVYTRRVIVYEYDTCMTHVRYTTTLSNDYAYPFKRDVTEFQNIYIYIYSYKSIILLRDN